MSEIMHGYTVCYNWIYPAAKSADTSTGRWSFASAEPACGTVCHATRITITTVYRLNTFKYCKYPYCLFRVNPFNRHIKTAEKRTNHIAIQ